MPLDLPKYLSAQKEIYAKVFSELKAGRKQSHWMWFIFPQLDGLGNSDTAKFYAIKSKEEAIEYLNHPLLGARLREISKVLLDLEENNPTQIFGFPDDLKLQSCMTLFSWIDQEESQVFHKVLNQYFEGKKCLKTLQLLGE